MPTYEYECAKCGAKFERFEQMSAAPVDVCPECGKKGVKRLFGAGVGIIMKGGSSNSMCDLSCGADAPCCGLDTPCGDRPCAL